MKKVLFMCVANSARSQMAEGIAKSIYLDFKIESAGSKPTKLNPNLWASFLIRFLCFSAVLKIACR